MGEGYQVGEGEVEIAKADRGVIGVTSACCTILQEFASLFAHVGVAVSSRNIFFMLQPPGYSFVVIGR